MTLMSLRNLLLLAVAASLLPACGSARSRPDDLGDRTSQPSVIEYTFEPVVIRAGVDDEGETWSTEVELRDLFQEANDYLVADDFDNALELYYLVLDVAREDEDDDYLRATHYNLGLSYEGLEQWFDAAEYFEAVIEQWPSTDDGRFAFFRLAECLANIGEYDQIEPLMERVLIRSDLSVIDELEAHLRWGHALLETRRFADAEQHYNAVIEINASAQRRWDPSTSDEDEEPVEEHDPMIAQALFGRARVYHQLFLGIRLVLPQDQLTRDLVDKSQLFDQAQDAYLDCVRTGHPYWAPAAGYMVGQLYEDFYFDILATEIPDTFGDLEHEIYFEELRAFIEPAMERAMSVYEHNLAMAYRLGSSNQWVDDTLESIERLQDYLINHEGWEDEHEQVIDRRHPRSAYFTDGLEFRSDR